MTANAALFLDLCPSADDLWLGYMTRLAGSAIALTGRAFPVITWPGSQQASLGKINFHGNENDRALARLHRYFGYTLA